MRGTIKQTLRRLYLENNGIGEQGTRFLAEALTQNTVIFFLCSISLFDPFSEKQTLLLLNLTANHIGTKGAQYLSDALRNKKVFVDCFDILSGMHAF